MTHTNNLTVQQLQCFVAVAEHQQFTAAAEQLGIAQPSLSAQIGRLERTLGAQLFHRDHRPVTLTDAGRELLPLARRALTGLDDVLHGVAEIEGLQRGHVTIGATPSLGAALLPSVLAIFHDRYPGVSIAVVERDSEELAEALESGALDLALVIMPVRRPMLESHLLAIEDLIVVVSSDHPIAERTFVTLEDLRDVPMIMFHEGYELRAVTQVAFDSAGVPLTVGLDGAEIGSVLAYVASGLGAAIVPGLVASGDERLRVLKLHSPKLQRSIGLVRPLRHSTSRAAIALSGVIVAYLRESEWPQKVHLDLRPLRRLAAGAPRRGASETGLR